MSGQHTPEPWTLRPRNGPQGRTVFGNGTQIISGDVHVASVTIYADKPIDQKLADARLIAAAPALLEALTEARRVLLMLTEPATIRATTAANAWAQAVAAEAKARAAIAAATPPASLEVE